jgi:putative DNA primase/helicase
MLTQKHLEEFSKSGIPKEIAETIFRSEDDCKKIANFLGWRGYQGPSGWLYEGIDPITGENTGIGQFKPDGGITFPNGDEAKYLTQKNEQGKGKFDACCIPIPGIDWQAVAQEDIEQLIRCVEGVKKSACSMIHTGIPTVGLSGVDMGTYGRGGTLVPTLKKLCVPGRPVEIAYDSDIIEKEGVRDAAKAFGRSLQKVGCQVQIRIWPQSLGKGLDDAITNVGVGEFNRQSKVMDFDEWLKANKKKRPPEQSVIADKMANLWKEKLAWRPDVQRWYRYGAEIEGIWSREPEELIGKLIAWELAARSIEFSAGYLSGILKLLKIHLTTKTWDEIPGFIPTKNGVINIDTLELLPHEPYRRLTWCLPYDYDEAAKCEPILQWLHEAVGGNESLVQLLRAYMGAILRGRSDLHGFIEIQGPGGSGKGTCLQLIKALVGARNTHTTKLKKLETSNFETAALHGKKLILIDDSDRYAGSVETLRSLTGGGEIPYEEKHVQHGDNSNFVCKAKVIIACNESILQITQVASKDGELMFPSQIKLQKKISAL